MGSNSSSLEADSPQTKPTDSPNQQGNTSHDSNSNSNLIGFLPNDPADPRNWSPLRRWTILMVLTITNFNVIWIASGYSPVESDFQSDFRTSREVAVLPLTLYVFGLAVGPMTLAPLSEYYGRSPIYFSAFFITGLFLIGTALVPTTAGFLILRFITGLFSSVSVANVGGSIIDMWHPNYTGLPLAITNATSAMGSSTGFFAFSFIAQKHGLRAVFWGMAGIDGVFLLMLLVTLRETRHSVILRKRAQKLRKETGNTALEVSAEMKAQPLIQMLKTNLSRPFILLFTEPVIMFCAIYNAYLFGLTFLFNGAFELVFGEMGYGFNTIEVGLANLGVVVGVLFGPVTHIWQERYYLKRVEEANGKMLPEARLQMSMVAAVVFPISLFWFAWTTYTSIHWIVPIIASAFYGWSFYTLILFTFMYVEDTYKVYSASALAGVCFLRNLGGGVFPLFGHQMFVNLGYRWAGSLLGFLALVMMPIPFILHTWGWKLRKRSPWAREHMDDLGDAEKEDMEAKVSRERV